MTRRTTARRRPRRRDAGVTGRRERHRILRRVARLASLTALLALVAGGGAVAAERAAKAIAQMELFRVTEIEVNNLRYLDQSTVLDLMALESDASVWDDPTPWIERLEHNPLVARASIRRALPHTLVMRVEESTPVALISTPTLEPIDALGRVLPLDPTLHRLDLPLLRASLDPSDRRFLSSRALQTLLDELLLLGEIVPDLAARVSSIGFAADGSVELHVFAPDVTLVYRAPATAERLDRGLQVLRDANHRRPSSPPRRIDLRFDDQVVVGFAGAGS